MREGNGPGGDLPPEGDGTLPVRQTIWIRPQSDFRAMTVFMGAIIDGYERLLEGGAAVELMVEADQIIIRRSSSVGKRCVRLTSGSA
jgi:hypothetical protein